MIVVIMMIMIVTNNSNPVRAIGPRRKAKGGSGGSGNRSAAVPQAGILFICI